MDSLQDMCAHALSQDPARPALERDGYWFTWGDLRQVADRVTQLLEASGADPAARIALLPRNRPAALAAMFAVIATGRNVRMVHVYQSAAGIARDIAGCKPALVIGMAEDLSDELAAAMRPLGIGAIALRDLDADLVEGCRQASAECERLEGMRIELLTSGTTGPPKPFAISFDMAARHLVGTNMLDTGDTVDPATLPPFFIYLSFSTITGLYLVLPSLLQGYRGVLIDRFTVPLWHDFVKRYQPKSVALPPPAVQMVLEADVPKADLAALEFITVGAAPLDPLVQRRFEERYDIPILQLYGATEFGGPVTFMTPELRRTWGTSKIGSVGRPTAGAQLRVVDADTGVVLPNGQAGILEVMTPRLGERWIRTSDEGLIDEDGFVFIRGRADGAIIRGGFKLLPDEIERGLNLHPAVSAAAVVGIADARLGQVPAAAIQLKPGVAAPGTSELEAHLREHVPATHIPVTWRFVESLPLTPMMKVDRVALRGLFDAVKLP
jgi:acyl-coenzyme A synthetase/AMP-(fatty) acid ligase